MYSSKFFQDTLNESKSSLVILSTCPIFPKYANCFLGITLDDVLSRVNKYFFSYQDSFHRLLAYRIAE